MTSASPGRKLAWWVADYAYAAYWQCRALIGRAHPSEYDSGPGRPVLILPGIWEPWAFMLPVMTALHEAGHPAHAMTSLRRNRAGVADSAAVVSAFLVANDLRNVLIVAHSKGGLIGKYAMTLLDAEHRISGMVAIATPFSGSWFARFLVLPSLRALSPADPTIRLLAADAAENRRIVSVYSEFDPHIPDGSELPGAINVEVPTGGHFRVIARPETIALVLEHAAAAGWEPGA